MYSTAHILVIGGGIAGQAVCEATRQLHPDVPITLVCGEEHPPYDRVRLGQLLTPGATVDELRLRPDAWYDDHAITLRLGTRVTALDPDAQSATLADGTVLHFEHAVLCTGS